MELVDDLGLLVDVASFKKAIRELCEELDSRTLLPTECPHVRVETHPDRVIARFDQREYTFPAEDVVLLDEVNISIEVLARHFWRGLATHPLDLVDVLSVEVGETDGQSCRYRRRLG